MKVLTGIDIVRIRDFDKAMKNGGHAFERRCFHVSELSDRTVPHLAGVYAAKEAVIKALSLPAGSWLDVKIGYASDGRPVVDVSSSTQRYVSIDISISHSDTHAAASCVVLV